MNEVNSVTNRGIPSNYDASIPADKKEEKKVQTDQKMQSGLEDVEKRDDPQYKAQLAKFVASFNEQPSNTKYDIMRVVQSLIDLGKVMQELAIVYAGCLSKSTARLTAINKQMKEIPVISVKDLRKAGLVKQSEIDKEDEINKGTAGTLTQAFGNAMEAMRAEKGLEEDFAKKLQVMMQSIKESGTQASDFVSTFLDLLRGISSKITQ